MAFLGRFVTWSAIYSTHSASAMVGSESVLLQALISLFLRMYTSSWKRGGEQAKVIDLKELEDEVELLRGAVDFVRRS